MRVSLISLLLTPGFLSCLGYTFHPTPTQISPEIQKAVLHLYHSHLVNQLSSMALSGEVSTHNLRHYFNDLTEEMLKSMNQLKIQLDFFRFHHPKSWDFFNIVLVDSAESFRKINPGEKTKKQDYSEFYLVVLKSPNIKSYAREMEEIFAYCWNYYVINVSILLEASNGSVQIFTYFPFREDECFSSRPVQVSGRNFFDMFPPKILDVHNCTLTAALWNVPPYLSFNKHGKGLDRFLGFEGRLLRELAEKMNFGVVSITPPNDQQRGLFLKNGSLTGAIKMLQEKTAHLSLGSFRCSLERSSLLTPSQNFYQTRQVYTVIARAEPWTTFEIITYPFDTYIWTLMMIILVALILLSFGLTRRHPKALQFIFGFRDTEVFINIISAWLGSPVVPEPKRTFARFILALWLFGTFVLRNSYQGLLFTFLHSNLAKQPPDTSSDLAQRGYLVVANMATYDTICNVPIIRDGHLKIFVKNMSDSGAFPLLEVSNGHQAAASPKDFLSYYVMSTKKYGLFHVLKETILTQPICIYFTKHSFLADRFNEVLINLRSSGLIDFWASQYLDDTYIEPRAEKSPERLPITLHQLTGVFQILLICLFAALIVFLGELLIAHQMWKRSSQS